MLVSYRCRRCHRPMVCGAKTWFRSGSDTLCGCGGSIEQIQQQYTGPLILRDDGIRYPRTHRRVLISIAVEVEEIRARHAQKREYNRQRAAARALLKKNKKHEISYALVDESDD